MNMQLVIIIPVVSPNDININIIGVSRHIAKTANTFIGSIISFRCSIISFR